MKVTIATIGRETSRKQSAAMEMFRVYCERISRYTRCETECYPTEERFLAALGRAMDRTNGKAIAKPHRSGQLSGRKASGKAEENQVGRNMPGLILLDSRGRQFSTAQFAQWLQRERDQATRHLLFAVGPADGWSDAARKRAELLLSLGPMTLPHELAAVVLSEQIYRAFTIVEGHPYHLGHA